MSWWTILGLAAGAYSLKALGPIALAGRTLPPRAGLALSLVAVPLFAALIVVQTVTSGHRFVADARLPAVAVAVVAVRLRAPFLAVVVLAAATCALVRLAGGLS